MLEADYMKIAKDRLYNAWLDLDNDTKAHIEKRNLIKEFDEREA